jgi:hypothetical protein
MVENGAKIMKYRWIFEKKKLEMGQKMGPKMRLKWMKMDQKWVKND